MGRPEHAVMKNAGGTFAKEIEERRSLPQSTGGGVFYDDGRVALDTREDDASEPTHLAMAHADSFVVLVGQIGKTKFLARFRRAEGGGTRNEHGTMMRRGFRPIRGRTPRA